MHTYVHVWQQRESDKNLVVTFAYNKHNKHNKNNKNNSNGSKVAKNARESKSTRIKVQSK